MDGDMVEREVAFFQVYAIGEANPKNSFGPFCRLNVPKDRITIASTSHTIFLSLT